MIVDFFKTQMTEKNRRDSAIKLELWDKDIKYDDGSIGKGRYVGR